MVSDWHILPILHTSFASFLVQVQGRCGIFFLRAIPALALNFSAKRHSGTTNKNNKSLIRG
jgi:hypothetical protein